jgi:hypothetical protein
LPLPAATHLLFLTCQETKTAFDPAALLQHRETASRLRHCDDPWQPVRAGADPKAWWVSQYAEMNFSTVGA